ncbi:MAG: kelch repeat-containing protein, partial [Planctomycetota bacterium]
MRRVMSSVFVLGIGMSGAFSDLAVAAPQGPVAPSARYAQAMAYDSARQRVVLFGGNSNGQWPAGALGDTWEWDGYSWEQKLPAASPAPRAHGAMAFDASRGVCVLFGGTLQPGTGLGETWEWNGVTWTQRSPSVSPSPRYHFAMTYEPAPVAWTRGLVRQQVTSSAGPSQRGDGTETRPHTNAGAPRA